MSIDGAECFGQFPVERAVRSNSTQNQTYRDLKELSNSENFIQIR